jgi:hypothetical protein
MLWAPHHYLRHVVVEDGDFQDVAFEHLEGHEVANIDLMSNGKFRSPLIQTDCAFDLFQLDHPRTAGVRLQDDRPRDGANILTEDSWNWKHFQP